VVAEKSSTNNEIVRAMKLEQKGFTWKKGLEVNASARLPKVNFIQGTEGRKIREPIAVGDGNKEAHEGIVNNGQILNQF
jgi:hypothetical protein